MTPLSQQLLAAIQEAMGTPDLESDSDGDVRVRYGSSVVFAGLIGSPPSVRILSGLLADVEETPALTSRLNEINSEAMFMRFYFHDGIVYATAELLAEPFIGAHVGAVFRYFCQIVDGIDDLLQAEFGGRTRFDESIAGPRGRH